MNRLDVRHVSSITRHALPGSTSTVSLARRKSAVVTVSALSVVCALLAACTEKTERSSGVQRERVSHLTTTEPAQPQHALDFVFEDKVRLVGYDIDKASVAPGDTFQVTWHWRVDAPLAPGWLQFTHLADTKDSRMNLDRQGPLRQAYPADAWQRGEHIRDPQTITLPADWRSDSLQLYVGFWQGAHRLKVTRGQHDGKNRALALSLPVGKGIAGSAPAADVPTLVAVRREGALRIDGKLDETDWQRAAVTPELVHTMTGAPGEPKATVRVLFDDEHVYLAFDVVDRELRSPFKKHDEHLWEQDAVEIMLDPTGDGLNYFEVQASPRGVVFDTRYDSRRRPQPFGHVDWSSNAQVGVTRRGEVDDDKADQGYTVEIALPWKSFEVAEVAPPKPGDSWRMNFYVMDAFKTEQGLKQRAVAWSPPKVGDFHMPARFGRIQFGEAPEATDDDTAAQVVDKVTVETQAAPEAPR